MNVNICTCSANCLFYELLCYINNWQAAALQLHSRHRNNNKMLNSSGLDVGTNFKHLNMGSSKTLTGIPSTDWVKNKHTGNQSHRTKDLQTKTHNYWQKSLGAIFTRALPLYLRETKRGQKRIFLYLLTNVLEGKPPSIFLW